MSNEHTIEPVDENLERVDEPVIINGTEIRPNGAASIESQPRSLSNLLPSSPLGLKHIDTGGNAFDNALYPLGNDELLAVYRKGGTGAHNGDGFIAQRRSTDGGDTWGSQTTIYDSSNSDRDPAGGVTPNGTLICFFIRTDVQNDTVTDAGFVRSTDGGNSWSSYTTLNNRGWSRGPIPFGSLIAIDGGSELLMPVWGTTDYDDPDGLLDSGEVWVISSTDDGQSWSYKGTIVNSSSGEDIRNETDIAALSDGTLIALVRRQDTTGYEQYYSTDDGASWTYDGVANIGVTGEEVSPILLSDGTVVKCISTHRANCYSERKVNWMSLATADDSSIVGSPGSWQDYKWLVQDANHGNVGGYPHIAETDDGQTLVTWSWYDVDGNYNLSMIDESSIRQLIAARSHVRYNSYMDEWGVSQNVPIYFDDQEILVSDSNPPNGSWTTEDISDMIPAGSHKAIFTNSVSSDGSNPDKASYLELRNPNRSGSNFDAYVTVPGDTSGLSGEAAECTLADGVFERKSDRVDRVYIRLAGFI